MLNLRTKNLNNAAAVLGGYDALVKAGLTIETGSPKASPAPAADNAGPAPAPSTPASPPAAKTSPTAPAPAATQAKRAKRHKAKTRH